MTVEQADAMIAAARKSDRLLVANLMQRYNPVYDAVDRLIQSGTLGELLHGYFENYASDENLPPEHWFWDRSKSGGIFVEHGVHFFDLFAGWLGPGTVVAAQRGLRPGSSPPIEEHVQCTVRYGPTVLVNFYHGFHQAGRMDRQELRLVFERGDVTLYRLGADQGPRSTRSPTRPRPAPCASCSPARGSTFRRPIRPRTAPARGATRHSTFTR